MKPNSKTDWIVRGLVAALVIAIGIVPKATADPQMLANFERWGYPDGFYRVIMAGEILGVALLLLPRTAVAGAGLVTTLMLGATGTHLKAGELGLAPVPLAISLLALWAGWTRWQAAQRSA